MWTRRQFLQAGSVAGLGPARGPAGGPPQVNCILLLLAGGPGQLDTWDPKPEAPSEIRGPYRAIPTNVAGVRISEIFPRMARHADKYALVRSVYHRGPAVHEAGFAMLGTGRLRMGVTHAELPAAGWIPRPESEAMHARYGRNRFGESCLLARQLVEAGVRLVTVTMFENVFSETTWDAHGAPPFSPMSCYRDLVGPMFDAAYSALIADLHQRGLLERTLVVATGEFGRTPWINPTGGRDHWPQCWTMLFAGGGVRGGQVIGESDAIAAEPRSRPVTPAQVAATIRQALGIPGDWPGARPIEELFV